MNLKASYVLLAEIGSTASGRAKLSAALGLCTPLDSQDDISTFLSYLQDPLFDLSEGSYPFPSAYITFALTDSLDPLPPWAMQVMCESLREDFGVAISGKPEEVDFTVTIGEVAVAVQWDVASGNGYSDPQLAASRALDLIAAAVKGIQVWYNVSQAQPSCVDWTSGAVSSPSTRTGAAKGPLPRHTGRRQLPPPPPLPPLLTKKSGAEECTVESSQLPSLFAWDLICCNDGVNLVNWVAQGVGRDLYWPPNQAKGFSKKTVVPHSLAYCRYFASTGLYGAPSAPDNWAFEIDTLYGGTRILHSASNIVFSNGNLDPWSAAGVAPPRRAVEEEGEGEWRNGVKVSQLRPSLLSVLIDMGGHHLDLFWATETDPLSAK